MTNKSRENFMLRHIYILPLCVLLAACAAPSVAQSKPGSPTPEQTGAQYCEYSKGHVETLKRILKSNPDWMSDAVRVSMQGDLIANEKEAATCCSDLDQCKRDFEAPPAKKK